MPLWFFFLIVLSLLIFIMNSLPRRAKKVGPKVGSPAPDFTLLDEKGASYSLSDLKGKTVALVFYPKPNTPGCTKQMCSIRDAFADLESAGVRVVGISSGSPESMKLFKDAHKLKIPLLIADEATLENYGTKGDFFSFFLPKRYTFLIDKEGIIVSIITKVDSANHGKQILDELKKEGIL